MRIRGFIWGFKIYVLLSPATASYDLYANYTERGDHFCRLVEDLHMGAAFASPGARI